MATPEQLVQEIAALRQELARQAQQHQQDLEQVRTESQQRTNEATQAALAAQGQLGTIPNVVREMGQTLQNALRERDKELVEAMRSSSSDKGKMVLVDTKGLGKPSMFSGDAEQYLPWRHRMTAYVCSIYPELREVLEWCEEREKSISSDELSEAFGEKADEIDRIPKLFDKSMELSSALQMVTAKEPFAIVINCNTNGFEAWRRLARRYDPATASRKRSMLKSVINPQKQKLEHLPQAIEEWLDAIASYEKRKDASGNRGKIPEEIKIAALESMLPQDLEAHVQLNQSKFAGFEDLLEEVTRYVEHRTGKTLKAFSTTQIAGKEALGDPMDVSSVGKGLGKHQQKTKFLGTCNNCGRTGHKAADCWSSAKGAKGSYSKQGPGKGTQGKPKGYPNPKGGQPNPKGTKGPKAGKGKGKTSSGKGKGKAKKGKGKGKYTNSLEEATGDEEWQEEGAQNEEPWEQDEWTGEQSWEEWPEESEWNEGNGLLIGGLEGRKEKKEEKTKEKTEERETKKGKSSAAVSGPSGSGGPTRKMPGFGDRLRNAGIDPEQLEGLNDDEAQELQDALLESLAALQARRAKARNTQPEEAVPAKAKAKEEAKASSSASLGARPRPAFVRPPSGPPPPKEKVSGSTKPAEPVKPPSVRAKAAQMLPRPKYTGESSTPKSGGRVPVPGSVRPAEPKGPPPVKTRGSRERGRSLERAPKSPRTSGKEPKKHEEERNREKASGSEDPKKHEEERNKEKASGSEETKGSRYKPKKKLTLRVMRELKSKEDWAKMNYSQRREHQERIRHLLPPGTVGQQILKKQGSACSTCRSRRRKTRKAVQEYLARKRKEYESLKKPPPVGLARSLLRREGMLKPPGERKGPSKKGPKEEKEASEESEGKSVEPPSSGQEEWSEEEEPKESDETVEVNEEEEEQGPPGRKKPTSHSGVSPAGGFELEVEELQPERRPKEPSEKEKARAREEHAARMRALQGQQLAPAEAKPKAEAKAIAKASDATADATSMSSSAAMQNMLQGSLLGSLTQDRGRLLKRLEEFKKEEMSEDDFEEKSQIEAELESILEQIAKLKERGLARPAPKAAGRLDQSVHDARYRAAIAKGMSHAKAWQEEKGRRRAAQQRQQGEKERATLNVEMQEAWAKHFTTVPGRKEDKVQVDAVETVTIDSSGKEIDPSTVRSSVAVPLTRKERTYYRQEYEEELKPRKEKVEKPPDPERRRRVNEKRAMRRKRLANKNKGKGKQKGKQESKTRGEKRKEPPEQDEDEEDEDEDWGDWKKPPRDPDEPRDPPEGEALVASVETTMATNAVSASGGRGSQRGRERVEVNFDSGAAVTVVPLKFGNGNEKPREEMKFKTASGENIADHGPIKLKGTTSTGNNATLHGRLADVHRVLGSASDICRTHHAVLGDNGGYLIPKQNAFGKEFNMMMRKLVRKYRDDPRSATRLHVRRGVYVFDLSCSPFPGQQDA